MREMNMRFKQMILMILLSLLGSFAPVLGESSLTTGKPTDTRPTRLSKNAITVDVNNIIKKVNKNILGISLTRIARKVWRKPLNFNDNNLRSMLNQLKPTFITIDNSILGLPFYKESTGKYSKRLSIFDTAVKMNLTHDPEGEKFFRQIKGDPTYRKPQHKNYDDILQFIEGLDSNPDISIRIPIIFTAQRKPYFGLKLNINPETGANLVHYLNDNNKTVLGKLRAENGHPEPYNINKFVLGNELWSNHDYGGLSLGQIVSQYIAFSKAMKQADPSTEIGISLVDNAYPHQFFKRGIAKKFKELIDYNDNILEKVKNDIDFVTFHVYSMVGETDLVRSLSTEQWKYVMAENAIKDKYLVAQKHRAIKNRHNAGLEIAVDEYSGPLLSLGGALYNADYLIYMLNQDYSFATAWNLGVMNEGDKIFGLLKTREKGNSFLFTKRPSYYSLMMFTNFVGEVIVETKVQSSTFDVKGITHRYFHWPSEKNIPSINVFASLEGDKLYLMVINRELTKDLGVTINLNHFLPQKNAKIHTLSGPFISSTNEKDPEPVKINESVFSTPSKSFQYNFKKHSLTVIVMERKKNREVHRNPAP